MRFTKMEGLGNDYIYLNCLDELPEDLPGLAVRLSDRHFGVGADGIICIRPGRGGDFSMDMYNADGSRAEMCGNGIRCVAKYVYDKGLTDKTDISVISYGQIKYLQLFLKEGQVDTVRVNMGAPELRPERIPVTVAEAGMPLEKERIVNAPIIVQGKEYKMTCVSM